MTLEPYQIVLLVVAGLVSLVLAGGGLRRGPLAEGLTLVGILLGALLMAEWGDVWGTDLAETVALGGDAGLTRFVIWLALFLAPVLVSYLAAVLLPRLTPLRARHRALGGLLGLLNGLSIIAFVVRAWYYTVEREAGALPVDQVARIFLDWAGWWPVALLLFGTGAVLAGAMGGAFRTRRVPPPKAPPVPLYPATPSTPSTSPSEGPIAPTVLQGEVVSPPPPPVQPAPVAEVIPPLVTQPRPVEPLVSPGNGASRPTRTVPPDNAGTARCRTCGKALPPGAAFCTNCGTPVEV